MLTRLDHLVILVRDLDRAFHDYERLGFRVTPGGEHADGLTRNALVPFEDGTYLELVAFVDPDDTRDNVWGWRAGPASGCSEGRRRAGGGALKSSSLSRDTIGVRR